MSTFGLVFLIFVVLGLTDKKLNNYNYFVDPTVRVAALGLFEALASSEPMTSEILDILGMSASDEKKEVNVQATNGHQHIDDDNNKNIQDKNLSPLLEICLENISHEVKHAII